MGSPEIRTLTRFIQEHLSQLDNHNALGIQNIRLVLNYYGPALERLGVKQRKFLLVSITKDQYSSDPASNEGHCLQNESLVTGEEEDHSMTINENEGSQFQMERPSNILW